MVNVGDVGAGVRAAEQTVDEANATVAAAVERFVQARSILGNLLATTQSPHAASAIEALAAAIARGEAAEVAMAETTTRLDEWLIAAGVPRRGESTATGRSAATEPQQRWRPRPSPTAINEIRPHAGRAIAAGRLYDEHGRPLGPICGPGGDHSGDLTGRWADSEPMRRHVEGAAAARSRRERHKRLQLYMNMDPCTKPDGPGCDQMLAGALRRTAELVVYVVRPTGTVDVYRYKGTGEGIAP